MSKSNTLENDWLLLYFNNTNAANVGDATGLRGSSSAGSLYVSLHTADPGEGGSQTTSETNYTSYARVAVARSGAGWTVSGNQAKNAAAITFPACTGGSSTIAYWGIGRSSSGAGTLDYSGPLVTTFYDFTAATSDTLTAPGHALIVNDPIVFVTIPNGTLPTGVTEGTIYYVKTVSSNDFTISATVGGATLDITAAGAGAVGKISTLAVSSGITPQFATDTLKVNED